MLNHSPGTYINDISNNVNIEIIVLIELLIVMFSDLNVTVSFQEFGPRDY